MAAHIMVSDLVVHIGPSERFVRAVFGIKVNNRQFSWDDDSRPRLAAI
jgi:hypothetical protein